MTEADRDALKRVLYDNIMSGYTNEDVKIYESSSRIENGFEIETLGLGDLEGNRWIFTRMSKTNKKAICE